MCSTCGKAVQRRCPALMLHHALPPLRRLLCVVPFSWASTCAQPNGQLHPGMHCAPHRLLLLIVSLQLRQHAHRPFQAADGLPRVQLHTRAGAQPMCGWVGSRQRRQLCCCGCSCPAVCGCWAATASLQAPRPSGLILTASSFRPAPATQLAVGSKPRTLHPPTCASCGLPEASSAAAYRVAAMAMAGPKPLSCSFRMSSACLAACTAWAGQLLGRYADACTLACRALAMQQLAAAELSGLQHEARIKRSRTDPIHISCLRHTVERELNHAAGCGPSTAALSLVALACTHTGSARPAHCSTARRGTPRTRFCCLRHALVQEANHAQLVVQRCQLQRLRPQNLLRLLGTYRRNGGQQRTLGELLISAGSGQSGSR